MAISKLARVARYPRTKIPKFSSAEIRTADLCARALWYGINFDTGRKQTSDAELMSYLANGMPQSAKEWESARKYCSEIANNKY